MTGSSCEVYMVRHGETEWNASGRLQGHTDIPLNSIGLNQAEMLNKSLAHINFSAAFSSDLSRAKETAKLVMAPRSVPLIATPALRERWAGSFEGKSVKELDSHLKHFFLSNPHLSQEHYLAAAWHPEIETLASVFQRVRAYLLNQIRHYRGQTILVVSHGGVIRSVLDHLHFIPGNKWIVSNCGFIKLRIDHHSFELQETEGVVPKALV